MGIVILNCEVGTRRKRSNNSVTLTVVLDTKVGRMWKSRDYCVMQENFQCLTMMAITFEMDPIVIMLPANYLDLQALIDKEM